jgi:hypothetical protein
MKKDSPLPLLALLEAIEIPDSAHERAESRYKDLGDWFGRDDSSCLAFVPEVFPQGSFLLGTVTRPTDADGEYDLDLAIKLTEGITKASHTQAELKALVGDELEAYRQARQIQQPLDEKRRCWRLLYKDEMSFHLDIVPCIPEDEPLRRQIKEAMLARDAEAQLAEEVAALTVSITDTEHKAYPRRSLEWHVSNPQGYGRWFASRVILARQTVQKRLMMENRASVEELPNYKLKAPLQRCVQLLKLHRDRMFKDATDCQPISIIITTLAARAYEGREDVTEALLHILDHMEGHIQPAAPRVPNPVNPDEDFSDKWDTDEGQRLDLEGHFHQWLAQARADFRVLAKTTDPDSLAGRAADMLGISPNRKLLQERLGGSLPSSRRAPAIVTPPQRIQTPPRPWADA